MKYGPNTQLVEEVINFVDNGNFFVPLSKPMDNVYIVHDLKEAKKWAWHEYDSCWNDLREHEEAELGIPDSEEVRKNLDELLEIFSKTFHKRKIFGRYMKGVYYDLLDDVLADLCCAAYNRAVNGKQSNFFEWLFEIYQAGGWPCGWRGDYPEGSLVAYFPVKDGS